MLLFFGQVTLSQVNKSLFCAIIIRCYLQNPKCTHQPKIINFPCVVPNFLCFPCLGKTDNQIPPFSLAVATLLYVLPFDSFLLHKFRARVNASQRIQYPCPYRSESLEADLDTKNRKVHLNTKKQNSTQKEEKIISALDEDNTGKKVLLLLKNIIYRQQYQNDDDERQ